jgi:hypothetical protein
MENVRTNSLLAMLGAVALSTFTVADASAAVVTTFGESVPVSNIITSFQPAGSVDGLAWFNDGGGNNGIRHIAQTFITPAGPNQNMDKITMQLNATLPSSFPNAAPISIDFYELTGPGQNPASGTYLSTQTGTIQPTSGTATAGSYFTFALDTPVTLTAGTSYGYVLAFTGASDPTNLLRPRTSSGGPDANGTRAFINTNGGGWLNSGETYTYYIQGTAVPEPAMGGVVLAGLGLLARRARRA